MKKQESNKGANIIKVPHGNVIKMAKAFNCTNAWISQALNGAIANTDSVKKIRHTALTQYGGIEMVPVESTKQ